MLCLAAGAVSAVLAIEGFTLSWMHSIEKIRWEEDWRIEGKTLVLKEARIRGSGAGMEPPEGAVLKNGVWHYRPQLPPQTVLRLSHSPHAGGYTLCTETLCRPLADHLPGIDNNAVIELRECTP
ncbi:DUF1850 domain-containing protein [Sulfuritalea hydrogenivorans]|jgi:hypothetical protein|uniref:DUF1850 domain-containing protein n=1 Tax=Sulfuritalea hydrogenivorans sk43H TaxID=1223802 RepID=W0SJT0_9PROT|nr:DUF1850 domain-containing protein [Sulfuritalea hydrogenivorans]BAO31016.1 hypothetical protein SUTH_03243 [Sulfuritalea hydrogenivorans sk43H]